MAADFLDEVMPEFRFVPEGAIAGCQEIRKLRVLALVVAQLVRDPFGDALADEPGHVPRVAVLDGVPAERQGDEPLSAEETGRMPVIPSFVAARRHNHDLRPGGLTRGGRLPMFRA